MKIASDNDKEETMKLGHAFYNDGKQVPLSLPGRGVRGEGAVTCV
jgi:hypothetical protein